MEIILKIAILIYGVLITLLLTASPNARCQAQQDPNQAPPAPPAEMQGGTQGSVRGPQGRGRGVFGKISAIRSDSIEVTRQDGTKISVKIASSTEFRKEREPAKVADFKVGDNVMIRTNQEPADSAGATALMVALVPAGFVRGGGAGGPGGMPGTMGKDFVAGEVKSLDPPKISILRVDNVTQTLELNEETSIRRGRESITMADIQPGDHIIARGASTNESFVPKMLNVVSPEQWKRMQEMISGEDRGGAPPPPGNRTPPSQQTPPEKPN